jgi:hypothetical protein
MQPANVEKKVYYSIKFVNTMFQLTGIFILLKFEQLNKSFIKVKPS